MAERISSEIGQHFIVGLSGPALSADDRKNLSQLRPLGVILRAHNFEASSDYQTWLSALSNLIDEIRTLTERNTPIIALDHEGGRVHRVPPPLTHFPFACEYRLKAREVGLAMGRELASSGINLSFAPVADIHSNPNNPVIGARSFGSNPAEVATAAVAYAKSLLECGVLPVAKHFPGHGDTSQDSHEELPTIQVNESTLRSRELVPFKSLVDAKIPAILTAHIVLEKFKEKVPATFSKELLTGILRGDFGFNGVIITDDLDMKAIAENFKDEVVAEKTLSAGCDILLFNHNPPRALEVAKIISRNLSSGSLPHESFESSSQRIQH